MKNLLLILILCQLLSFSGRSQSITISDKSICFDSAAAVKLYKTITQNEYYKFEAEFNNEIIANYDSTVQTDAWFIEFLRHQNDTLASRYNYLSNEYQIEITRLKKQNRLIKIFTGSSIAIFIMRLIFK